MNPSTLHSVFLRKALPALCLLASLSVSAIAQAQLVLRVDPTSKTLWMEGSDSGSSANTNSVMWQTGSVSAGYYGIAPLTTDFVSITTDNFFIRQLLFNDQTSPTEFNLTFAGGNADNYDFVGGGQANAISYASISAGQQSLLEEGRTLLLGYGSGFSSIAVQVGAASAVPEPSTYALLFGVGAFGCVACRRRRQPHRGGQPYQIGSDLVPVR